MDERRKFQLGVCEVKVQLYQPEWAYRVRMISQPVHVEGNRCEDEEGR